MEKTIPGFEEDELEDDLDDADAELSASESGSEPESGEPGGVGAIFAEDSQSPFMESMCLADVQSMV